MKRQIKYIAIHCTATQPTATVAAIQRYWRDSLGWKSPGYHLLIEPNGTIHRLLDFNGIASMDSRFNPNQSVAAIEGIFSPDGRVFGKMAHSERVGYGISKNIPGQLEMPIFTSGVKYFK